MESKWICLWKWTPLWREGHWNANAWILGNYEHTAGPTYFSVCQSVKRSTSCKLLMHLNHQWHFSQQVGVRPLGHLIPSEHFLLLSVFFFLQFLLKSWLGSPPIPAICLFLQRHGHTSPFVFIFTFLSLFARYLTKQSWQGEIRRWQGARRGQGNYLFPCMSFCLFYSSSHVHRMFMHILNVQFCWNCTFHLQFYGREDLMPRLLGGKGTDGENLPVRVCFNWASRQQWTHHSSWIM